MMKAMTRAHAREQAPVSRRERAIRAGLFAGSFALTGALVYPGIQAAVGIEPCTVRPIEPVSYLALPVCTVAHIVSPHLR